MPRRRAPLALITPETTPEEAAAIVAAIEQFVRATARGAEESSPDPEPWLRAAILEGVSRADLPDTREPWINT